MIIAIIGLAAVVLLLFLVATLLNRWQTKTEASARRFALEKSGKTTLRDDEIREIVAEEIARLYVAGRTEEAVVLARKTIADHWELLRITKGIRTGQYPAGRQKGAHLDR